MRNEPEYPDLDDQIAIDLARECGCDQFLLAKSAMEDADNVINSVQAYGAECDWIKMFKARCLQHGIRIQIINEGEPDL